MDLINNRNEGGLPLTNLQYRWAWEHYLNGTSNNWTPMEVPMGEDVLLWKSDELTQSEKELILFSISFFSLAETLVANNLVLAIYKWITNVECRIYLLRQAFEEAVHAHAFQYIIHSLNLDSQMLTALSLSPSIQRKEEFEKKLTTPFFDPLFSTGTKEGAEHFLENLIGFYLILEGIFLYGGFAMLLSFKRQNKMKGISQLIEFILRDETIHLNFGIDLINGIKEENPHLWTKQFTKRITEQIDKAVCLEIDFGKEALSNDLFGLNFEHYQLYVQYLAVRRLERIGIAKIYRTSNPLFWMSEVTDLYKEKNFFEMTSTEYRTGSSIDWTEK